MSFPTMPFPTMPNPAADRKRHEARWNPDRETLELAAAGAAKVLGEDHRATQVLRRDQREAIAEAGEG